MTEGREKLKTPEQQLLLRWADAYRALLDKLQENQRPHEIKDCLLEVYKEIDCYLGEIIDKSGKALWSREWPTEVGFYWYYDDNWPYMPLVKVVSVSSGRLVFINGNTFFHKGERDGYWSKATLPEPPKETIKS